MIHVNVRERDAAAQATAPVTAGSVGLPVVFCFSEDWEGLGRTAVFQGSGNAVDVALTSAGSCAVPHEVLQRAGGHLKIGVYGSGNEGQRVTPTIWADVGQIQEGAEPAEVTPTPATQSLVQQILEAAESAEAIARGVRDDAASGAFDGTDGASAYELAVEHGYTGTEAQWLQSLHGRDAVVDATLSNSGEAADAAAAGAVKAKADEAQAELTALVPITDHSDYSWTLDRHIDNTGSIYTSTSWAMTAKKSTSPGVLFQNASTAPDADGKYTMLSVNEYSGDTWLRRTLLNPGESCVIGASADGYRLTFGYPSAQSGTISQAKIETYFGVRIVEPIPSGGGTSLTVDSALSDSSENPVQNKVIKAALDAKGTYSKPSGGIPAADLASGVIPTVPSAYTSNPAALGTASAGSSTSYAKGDHVHPKPSAADIGAVAANQGSGNAGKFLVVGNDGNVTTMTLSTWSAGSY